jgi:hypothetical protein
LESAVALLGFGLPEEAAWAVSESTEEAQASPQTACATAMKLVSRSGKARLEARRKRAKKYYVK